MPGALTKKIMSAPGPKLKMWNLEIIAGNMCFYWKYISEHKQKRLYTPPFYGYQIIVFMTKDFWLRADFVIYNEHIL